MVENTATIVIMNLECTHIQAAALCPELEAVSYDHFSPSLLRSHASVFHHSLPFYVLIHHGLVRQIPSVCKYPV